MVWVRRSDDVPLLRPYRALSDAACWLHHCMLSYSARELSDGMIDRADLDMVRPGADPAARTAALAELEQVGAIKPTATGWRVVLDLDLQPSAEEVRKRREQDVERQRRKRERDLEAQPSRRDADRESQSESRAPVPSRPVPPRPDSEPDPLTAPVGAVERASARPARPKPTAKWHRFPSEYEPTASDRALAKSLRVDFETEFAKLLDHEFAKPKRDAAATLRNWLRTAARFNGGNVRPLPPRGPAAVSDWGDDARNASGDERAAGGAN